MINMESYWHNEEHGLTIYHGDNTEVMWDIDTDSIDFCVTSPPYAQGLEYEQGLDWDGLWDLIDETSSTLYECMKPSAFCMVNFGETTKYERTMAELYNGAFIGNNWIMHSRRIWHKPFALCGFSPAGINNTVPIGEWENIWTFRKPPNEKEKFRCRELTTHGVWQPTDAENANDNNTLSRHVAAFPCYVPTWGLKCWSDPSDVVLDPFMGSGTTLAACYRMERHGIGIEINEQYCEIAAKRLEKEIAQCRMFSPVEVAAAQTQTSMEAE